MGSVSAVGTLYGGIAMKLNSIVVCALAAGLAQTSVVTFAHHGDAGRYDETITSLAGTVVALQLINPHSTIILDVADENGDVVRWQAELSGANNLSRSGWTKETLKPGDEIAVSGRIVKSGAPFINLSERARIVTMDPCEEIYRSRSDPEGPLACE